MTLNMISRLLEIAQKITNLKFGLLRVLRFKKNSKTVFFEAIYQPWYIIHSSAK